MGRDGQRDGLDFACQRKSIRARQLHLRSSSVQQAWGIALDTSTDGMKALMPKPAEEMVFATAARCPTADHGPAGGKPGLADSMNSKVVPTSISLRAWMGTPWISMMRLAMAKPRPAPAALVGAPRALKKRSKM